MSEPGGNVSVRVMDRAARRFGRAPLVFAMVSVVIALAAGGLYVFRQSSAPPRLTPEETVREFLSAVFLAADAQRVSTVVCSSWDPSNAITRTAREVPTDAHVSWDELSVVSSAEDRATLRARLGIRLRDDLKPSSYAQWRFSLVKESGWRVCDARPFVV